MMERSENAETTEETCPYCAETIRAGAVLCPHCRSRLGDAAAPTYRNRPGKQIAGVAIALAEAFGLSVTFVRLVFILLTFTNFVGPILYAVLWVLLPAEKGGLSPIGRLLNAVESETPGSPSILERAMAWAKGLFGRTEAPPPETEEHSS